MRAFCWASGQIEFAARVPEGALPIARGPARALRDFIDGVARHAYDGETLLVPGIPESQGDQSRARDALHAWLNWISDHPVPDGVEVL